MSHEHEMNDEPSITNAPSTPRAVTVRSSFAIRHSSFRRARPGFTLLEIIIALSVFLIIIAGVFAIAKGSMELSEDLTASQERAMTRQNFIEFLRSSFRRIPGDGELLLAVENQRGTYVPTLTVFNGGDAFSPGPSLPPDTSVELFAQDMPGGSLRIGLRLFDSQQTNTMRLGTYKRRPPSKNDVVLPLIANVQRFEIRFLDSNSGKWENNWKSPVRPLFAEMLLTLDDGIQSRSVFWIPPITKRIQGQNLAPQLGPDGQPLPPGTLPPGTTPPIPGNPNLSPNANPNALNVPPLSK
jgi:prepilin-type N-terminal cleavage/methylation domain-containing protein